MGIYKKVFSVSKTPLRPLGVSYRQFRVVAEGRITNPLYRNYGEYLAVVDDTTGILEYCGARITERDLRMLRVTGHTCKTMTPEMKAYFKTEAATEKPMVPKKETKPEAAKVAPEVKPLPSKEVEAEKPAEPEVEKPVEVKAEEKPVAKPAPRKKTTRKPKAEPKKEAAPAEKKEEVKPEPKKPELKETEENPFE